MLANALRIIVSAILRYFSNAAKEWHERELRDRRNRKIVMDGVEEVVNEAKKHNIEIADSPESIGKSIDRLRDLARKRSESSGSYLDGSPKIGQPLRFGEVDAKRNGRTPEDNQGESTEVSGSISPDP